MNGFLSEIGKKLAERRVALPGLLYLVAVAARVLGLSHALDTARMSDWITARAQAPAIRSAGRAVLVAALLAGSVIAGMTAMSVRPPKAGQRARRSRSRRTISAGASSAMKWPAVVVWWRRSSAQAPHRAAAS